MPRLYYLVDGFDKINILKLLVCTEKGLAMTTCLKLLSLAVATIALQSIVVMPSNAAPPDGVTFITEIAGYAGENPYSEDAEWYPSLDVDNDGDLWVCSNGHVFEYHGGEWIDHTDASGGGDYVAITSEGVVWVASSEHLASYDGSAWEDHSEGIPANIQALAAEGDDVWMAERKLDTDNFYLGYFDGETVRTYHEGLLQNYISRLTATADGVWIVYHNFYDQFDCDGDNCPRGTSFFDGTTFHHYSIENGMPMKDNPYWADTTDVPWLVYSSRQDKTFAICNSYLVEYRNGEWPVIYDGLILDNPIVEGTDGRLWQGFIGLSGWGQALAATISYFEEDRWNVFDTTELTAWIYGDFQEEYDTEWTYDMEVTGDGIAWFGLSSGVMRIDTNLLCRNSTIVESNVPTSTQRIVSYPNPFNSITTIHFELPETAQVEADIYSITGQHVRRLSAGWLPAGEHAIQWDGRDDTGNMLSSGMYIVNIKNSVINLSGNVLFIK